MEKQNLEDFKTLFLNLKKNVTEQSSEIRSLVEVPEKDGDEVDRAMGEREKAMLLKLRGRQQFYLKKIDTALTKIDQGRFGECEDCGADINLKRLMARPTATMCINCKEEQEREESNVLYEKRSHTLGRSIESSAAPIIGEGDRLESKEKPKLRLVQ